MSSGRMRQRKVLTIWRDDHIGDAVGGIFLDREGEGADAIFDRLSDYLGRRVKIIKVELMRDRLTAEVRLARVARGIEPSGGGP